MFDQGPAGARGPLVDAERRVGARHPRCLAPARYDSAPQRRVRRAIRLREMIMAADLNGAVAEVRDRNGDGRAPLVEDDFTGRDFDRAGQWCDQLAAFCDRTGQRPLLALCRAHHGTVLMVRVGKARGHDVDVTM